MDKIWVLAEQSEGVPAGVVLELSDGGSRLRPRVVEAVTWGPGVRECLPVPSPLTVRRRFTTSGSSASHWRDRRWPAAIAAHLSGGRQTRRHFDRRHLRRP